MAIFQFFQALIFHRLALSNPLDAHTLVPDLDIQSVSDSRNSNFFAIGLRARHFGTLEAQSL